MITSSRRFLIGVLLLLAAGIAIGWFYGHADRGLLAAALIALLWQLRNTIAFNRGLHSGNFDTFRYGDGIWEQIFSRFSYERDRGDRYKTLQRQLLKEIRKSTNAMPDGAVILDADNEIVACNRAAKALAGLKRKKDRGQRVDNILRDPGLSELLQQHDPTISIDIASPIKDGAWLNCRVVPYGVEQKMLLLRDVTDRIQLNKVRRDFVANASHELRSPLTVISGYLDSFADDDDVPKDLAQPIVQMQSQARRMTSIISELLELSRLESGGKATKDETVDVAALLVASRKAHTGTQDSATIEVQIESTAQILGKAGEIDSVIENLISNASRHTPADGQITLIWRAAAERVELIVRDSGEGIAAEHVPRLTERFFRVDRGRARSDGGVGLGLAIVKHVLERHDAELRVSSEVGVGTEFTCIFPAERISAPAADSLTH